ncbi:MAG: AEC family transporter [Ruminococcus sp.]|nr:AEC family transporter [Ruminococcus sp.]
MENAEIILNQTLIMLILIIVGIICKKTKIITDDGNKELSKLVLTVVNPIVILMAYQTDYKPQLVKNLLIAFGLSILSYIILIVAAYLLIPQKDGRETQIERFSAIYSNCGFMGIPLVNALFGSEGIFYLTAFLTVFNLVVWTHGIILISGERNLKNIVKVFYSPVIISIVLGIIMFFAQIRLPDIITDSLNFISNLNTPLAMIVSGVTIADTKILKLLKKPGIYYVSFLKLILLPLILIAVFSLFNVNEQVRITVLVAASAPAAAMCTLQCIRYEKNSLYASEIFAASTILSVVTLPIIVHIDNLFS